MVRRGLLLFYIVLYFNAYSQNSLVGDGFGGRLWYTPLNYTVGSYSAYTVCGSDNQLYAWGGNGSAQLGDSTRLFRFSPVKVKGMNNVKFYSCGYIMGAIKQDNSGWVWGSSLNLVKPKKVIDNVFFCDAAMTIISFVKTDGTVWSVGNGSSGAFGNDTLLTMITAVPRKMKNITNAVRTAVSGSVVFVLNKNGKVLSCGQDSKGLLGQGVSVTKSAVPSILSGLDNIIDIKANTSNAIALDKDGNVYAWGWALYGGNGNNDMTKNVFIPTKISGLNDIVAISGCADGFHFLALDKNNNCYVWGYSYNNSFPVSGSNLTISTPIIIASDVIDILAGETFTYIVKSDKSIWAAGRSNGGSVFLDSPSLVRLQFANITKNIQKKNLCLPYNYNGDLSISVKRICYTDSFEFTANSKVGASSFKWELLSQKYTGTKIKIAIKDTSVNTIKLKGYYTQDSASINYYFQNKNRKNYGKYLSDTFFCDNINFIIQPKLHIGLPLMYLWQDNSIAKNYITNKAGKYTLELTDSFGCKFKDSMNILLKVKPTLSVKINDKKQCEKNNYFLLENIVNPSNDKLKFWEWKFNNSVYLNKNSITFNNIKFGSYIVRLMAETVYGCRDSIFDTIEIVKNPVANFKKIKPVCLGEKTEFFSMSIGNNFITKTEWFLDNSLISTDKNFQYTFTKPGVYGVKLIAGNENKCLDSITINNAAVIYDLPKASFTYTIKKDSIQILFTVLNNSTGKQLFSKYIFNKTIIAQKDTMLQFFTNKLITTKLIVKDTNGCIDSIEKSVTMQLNPKPNVEIYIPNAFSPDNNYLNNVFGPEGFFEPSQFQFTIYNRWGQKLFESNNHHNFWNGTYMNKPCIEGVYVYLIQMQTKFGFKEYRGTVHLIRGIKH